MPKVGMEEIRREQVIAATTRCIVNKGMVNLSVKDIAAEAGVSTGIIYHYFKNKEEILMHVIKAAFQQSHQAVMDTVEPLDSPRDKLFKHIENINAVAKHNSEFYKLFLNYLGQTGSNEQVGAVVKKFFKNLRAYVQKYLTEGVNREIFPSKTAKDLPAIIIALGMGLGIMWTVDQEAFDLDEMSETYKEVIGKFIEP